MDNIENILERLNTLRDEYYQIKDIERIGLENCVAKLEAVTMSGGAMTGDWQTWSAEIEIEMAQNTIKRYFKEKKEKVENEIKKLLDQRTRLGG